MKETILIPIELEIPKTWSELTNEQLYYVLSKRRDTFEDDDLSECVRMLYERLLDCGMRISSKYWSDFRWTRDDAKMDIMEFIWILCCTKHLNGKIKPYFCRSYRGRMLHGYRDEAVRGPVPYGDIKYGYNADGSPIVQRLYILRLRYVEELDKKQKEYRKNWRERNKDKINAYNRERSKMRRNINS